MATGIKGGLGAIMASVKALEGVPWVVAAKPHAEAYMRGRLDAGQTPEGQPWVPTKGGKRPLRRAAQELEVRVSGSALVFRIHGRHAFHHFGAQGKPARRQLPAGALPMKLGQAVRAGLVTAFKSTIGRGRGR